MARRVSSWWGFLIGVFSYIGTNVALAEILDELNRKGFNLPLTERWFCQSFYSGLMLPYLYKECRRKASSDQRKDGYIGVEENNTGYQTGNLRRFQFLRDLFKPTLVVALLATTAGMIWTISVTGTAVPTNNALTRVRTVWVFLGSALFLKEKVTWVKVVAVVLSLGGCVLFSLNAWIFPNPDAKTDVDEWWGILLTIIASALFAAWDTLFKYYTKDDLFEQQGDVGGTLVFQAMLGVWGTVLFWPVPLVEILVLGWQPVTLEIAAWMLVLAATLVINELGFVMAITYSTPLYTNMACLFVVPVSFVVDVILQGYQVTYLAVVGATLILAGFVFLELKCEQRDSQQLDVDSGALNS